MLELLGPPSQLLQLGDHMVFYYLLESVHTKSLFLAVYNTSDSTVRYDRAVFFFDGDDVLEELALSAEQLPTRAEAGGAGE